MHENKKVKSGTAREGNWYMHIYPVIGEKIGMVQCKMKYLNVYYL